MKHNDNEQARADGQSQSAQNMGFLDCQLQEISIESQLIEKHSNKLINDGPLERAQQGRHGHNAAKIHQENSRQLQATQSYNRDSSIGSLEKQFQAHLSDPDARESVLNNSEIQKFGELTNGPSCRVVQANEMHTEKQCIEKEAPQLFEKQEMAPESSKMKPLFEVTDSLMDVTQQRRNQIAGSNFNGSTKGTCMNARQVSQIDRLSETRGQQDSNIVNSYPIGQKEVEGEKSQQIAIKDLFRVVKVEEKQPQFLGSQIYKHGFQTKTRKINTPNSYNKKMAISAHQMQPAVGIQDEHFRTILGQANQTNENIDGTIQIQDNPHTVLKGFVKDTATIQMPPCKQDDEKVLSDYQKDHGLESQQDQIGFQIRGISNANQTQANFEQADGNQHGDRFPETDFIQNRVQSRDQQTEGMKGQDSENSVELLSQQSKLQEQFKIQNHNDCKRTDRPQKQISTHRKLKMDRADQNIKKKDKEDSENQEFSEQKLGKVQRTDEPDLIFNFEEVAGGKLAETQKNHWERQRLFRVSTQKEQQLLLTRVKNYNGQETQKQQTISIRSSVDDKNVQLLINFFRVDYQSQREHIYAHKEFFRLKEAEPARSRIKKDSQILEALKTESVQLKQYMKRTYNIELEIDPKHGCILQFPFKQRWLRGEEYGFLCRHYYAYSQIFKMFQILDHEHPDSIYSSPQFGQFYYIKGMHLQYFGFPRKKCKQLAPEKSGLFNNGDSKEQLDDREMNCEDEEDEVMTDNSNSQGSACSNSNDGSSSSKPIDSQVAHNTNSQAQKQKTQIVQDQLTLSKEGFNQIQQLYAEDKIKKFKWKKTNFKTPLPKHDPVVLYVTANTKNREEHQCMMHAGTLAQEFDQIYTKKGHGKQLREKHTKLTVKDQNADLQVHERIVFCHVLDMRESDKKKLMAISGAHESTPNDLKTVNNEPRQIDKNVDLNVLVAQNIGFGTELSSEAQNLSKILRRMPKNLQINHDKANGKTLNTSQLSQTNLMLNELCEPHHKPKSRYGPRGPYKKRQSKNEKSINEDQTKQLLNGFDHLRDKSLQLENQDKAERDNQNELEIKIPTVQRDGVGPFDANQQSKYKSQLCQVGSANVNTMPYQNQLVDQNDYEMSEQDYQNDLEKMQKENESYILGSIRNIKQRMDQIQLERDNILEQTYQQAKIKKCGILDRKSDEDQVRAEFDDKNEQVDLPNEQLPRQQQLTTSQKSDQNKEQIDNKQLFHSQMVDTVQNEMEAEESGPSNELFNGDLDQIISNQNQATDLEQPQQFGESVTQGKDLELSGDNYCTYNQAVTNDVPCNQLINPQNEANESEQMHQAVKQSKQSQQVPPMNKFDLGNNNLIFYRELPEHQFGTSFAQPSGQVPAASSLSTHFISPSLNVKDTNIQQNHQQVLANSRQVSKQGRQRSRNPIISDSIDSRSSSSNCSSQEVPNNIIRGDVLNPELNDRVQFHLPNGMKQGAQRGIQYQRINNGMPRYVRQLTVQSNQQRSSCSSSMDDDSPDRHQVGYLKNNTRFQSEIANRRHKPIDNQGSFMNKLPMDDQFVNGGASQNQYMQINKMNYQGMRTPDRQISPKAYSSEGISPEQLAKKRRQLKLLDQIKVQDVCNDNDKVLESDDSSLQIKVDNCKDSPDLEIKNIHANLQSRNDIKQQKQQAGSPKNDQLEFVMRRKYLDSGVDQLFRQLRKDIDSMSSYDIVRKFSAFLDSHSMRCKGQAGQSTQLTIRNEALANKIQDEWNNLPAIQELNITLQGLKDYYLLNKNKNMVKEFYYRSKIKQINTQIHSVEQNWANKVGTILRDIQQPSLKEALFQENDQSMSPNNGNSRKSRSPVKKERSSIKNIRFGEF